MIECLQLLRPINAIMGIYPELGDCKLYDYSLQDAPTDRLSDETVYVYLRLLANNQVKNKVEVLAPAGILPLEEIPIDTDVIKRRPLDELFQIDTIICCMVSNDHWTLTVIIHNQTKGKEHLSHKSTWRTSCFCKKTRTKMEV
nr:unnamed protein product [Hydra vulgaris]